MRATTLHDPDQRALARRELARSDPRLAAAMRHYDDPWPTRRRSAIATLARILVGQQISVNAAATIYGRLAARCGGQITAAGLDQLGETDLHGCGLSRQKRAGLKDLSTRTLDGRINPGQLWRLDDEGVRNAVTSVRGLGPWSAEIYMMFGLGRPDLLPLDDLGLRAGFARLLGRRKPPAPRTMLNTARPWRPWRTLACLYLWALLDNPPASTEKT